MIEEDLGAAVAARVAKSMLMSFRRPGGSPQISVTLNAQEKQAGPIANLLTWLPENLHRNLSIRNLARNAAMSRSDPKHKIESTDYWNERPKEN